MKKMMKISLVAAMALVGSTGVSSAGIFDWDSGGTDSQIGGWADDGNYGMSSGDISGALDALVGGGWNGRLVPTNVSHVPNPHAVSANAGEAGDYGYDGLNRSEDRLAAAATDIYDDAVNHPSKVSFDAPSTTTPPPPPSTGGGSGGEEGFNNFKDSGGNWHYTDSQGVTHKGTDFSGNSGVGAGTTGNGAMDALNGHP